MKRSFALGNPNRIKIYDLCLLQRLNITQIAEKISQSYKSVLNNLRILEEAGMIKREKETTEKAQETFIISIPFDKDTIWFKLYIGFKNEVRPH